MYIVEDELEIPIPFDSFNDDTTPRAWQAFHDLHQTRFGFNIPRETIEIITVKATVVSLTEKPEFATIGKAKGDVPSEVARRQVMFDDGRHDTPIYNRTDLGEGHRLTGPAVGRSAAAELQSRGLSQRRRRRASLSVRFHAKRGNEELRSP